MPVRDFFHSVMHIGPVQIGTHHDRHGVPDHTRRLIKACKLLDPHCPDRRL